MAKSTNKKPAATSKAPKAAGESKAATTAADQQPEAPASLGPIPGAETRPAAAEVERTDASPAGPTDATPPDAETEGDIAGKIAGADSADASGDEAGDETVDPKDADDADEPTEEAGAKSGGDGSAFKPPENPDNSCSNTAEYLVLGPLFEEGRGYERGAHISLTPERARAIGCNLLEGPLPR